MDRSDLDPTVRGSSAALMEINSLVRHPAGSHSVIEEEEPLAHLRCGTPTPCWTVRVVGLGSRLSKRCVVYSAIRWPRPCSDVI